MTTRGERTMKRLLHYTLHLQNTAYAIVLIAVAIAIYYLSGLLPLHLDVTRNASNSLMDSSAQILKQLPGKINITMYANSKDAELGDIEQLVTDFISIYQRYKPDISLTFIDPVKNADATRNANVRSGREMQIEYNGRIEHLTLINEQAVSSALLRLAHRQEQTILYMDGHGERKLEGAANHDLGEFGKKLKQNGYKLASLNLVLAQDIPANASLLLITHPQAKLLPGEVDKLLRYVDGGGNVLWLLDAEPLLGLERLASRLGILLTSGQIVDPDAKKMNVPVNWTLGASYPPHPVTSNFNLVTAFPNARALGREETAREDSAPQNGNTRSSRTPWQRSTLIEAASNGWVSRNPLPQSAQFDKNRDMHGPFSIAVALQRGINERQQRIVVVGSGAFLANTYSGNGGNIDLGINMVNWLSNEEHLITEQPRATLDNSIILSKNQINALSYGMVIGVPLLLVIIGGVQWWRRRN